jgi:hypothetical protein
MKRLCCDLLVVRVAALMAVLLGAFGCASSRGPEYLAISAEQYDDAFDAATRVARAHGLIPGLRDRRGGVIETEPAKAGAILEPCDRLNATFGRSIENTLSHQRRVARFEFLPVAFDPERTRIDDPLTGPDIFAERREPLDLTAFEGELELRVWVYIERFHRSGQRRSTWTRRKTTRTQVIDPESGRPIGGAWIPIVRDPEIERLLLAQVQRELGR